MKSYTVTSWKDGDPEAYLSNGFIGCRIGKDPFHEVTFLLNGFYGRRKFGDMESLNILPAPNYDFEVNGEKCLPNTLKQTYDFSVGELKTELVLPTKNGAVNVQYTVFASRTSPSLFLGELDFSADAPTDVKVYLTYNTVKDRVHLVGDISYPCYEGEDFDGKALVCSCDNRHTAGICFKILGDFTDRDRFQPMATAFCVHVGQDTKRVQIMTSYIPDVLHEEPHCQAHRMIKLSCWTGFEALREKHRQAWIDTWKGRIVIEGASEEWQEAVDASFYYLMSSVSEFSAVPVAPFGLSHPDLYEGHIFWDTDSFMMLPPMLLRPKVARQMLEYRYKRLDAAINNAKINGYCGAQYPWQSALTGSEATGPWCGGAGGAAEQHVTLDVALAFEGFARVSGDEEFLKNRAWPVISQVAEWVASRVEKTSRGYEILHVTGIEEGIDDVPNDSFTNLMSIRILRCASALSEKLGYGKREDYLKLAEKIIIPRRPNGVMEHYEGMPEKDVQSAVIMMSYFPYGFTDTPENDRKTMEYYITHGMERYCTTPMLAGFLGIFPAWLGDGDTALQYYETANLSFFVNPYHACLEVGCSKEKMEHRHGPYDTCFITSRGSFLAGLLMGLTKMVPWRGDGDPKDWFGENIVLPTGWNKIVCNRVYIGGKAYRLTAENGASRAVLEEITE